MGSKKKHNGDNVVLLKNGQTWLCHSKDVCKDNTTPCVFHNSTEHPMDRFPLQTRYDRAFLYDPEDPDNHFPTKGIQLLLLERRCSHGVGHPDPDCVTWLESIYPNSWGIHGCDGCGHEEI